MIKIINNSSDVYQFGGVTIAANATTLLSISDVFEVFANESFIDNLKNANLVVEDGGNRREYPDCLETFKWAVRNVQQSVGTNRRSFAVTTQQTNATIWTPASGKRIILTGYQLSIHNNTLAAQSVQIFEETNTAANMIYNAVMASGSSYDISHSLLPVVPLAIDNRIRATTSAGLRAAGVLFGFEV